MAKHAWQKLGDNYRQQAYERIAAIRRAVRSNPMCECTHDLSDHRQPTWDNSSTACNRTTCNCQQFQKWVQEL